MSDRIDHAALAGQAIGKALVLAENEEATSITHAMVAQARAALALVEQQRIANLLALGQYKILPNDMPIYRGVIFAGEEVKPEIREALGL